MSWMRRLLISQFANLASLIDFRAMLIVARIRRYLGDLESTRRWGWTQSKRFLHWESWKTFFTEYFCRLLKSKVWIPNFLNEHTVWEFSISWVFLVFLCNSLRSLCNSLRSFWTVYGLAISNTKNRLLARARFSWTFAALWGLEKVLKSRMKILKSKWSLNQV